jgi:hypothetical protein
MVTRTLAIWAGLATGFTTWISVREMPGVLGWALAVLLPFLAFAVMAALITMTAADLRKREVVSVSEPVPDADHGETPGGHH